MIVFFYQDMTFKIRIWRYGVSSGLHESLIEGNYRDNPKIGTIELIPDEKSVKGIPYNSNGKPYPTIYFMMEGLKIKMRLHLDYIKEDDIPILSKPTIKSIKKVGNRIEVELYAFNERGEQISFGYQNYIREKLETGNDCELHY